MKGVGRAFQSGALDPRGQRTPREQGPRKVSERGRCPPGQMGVGAGAWEGLQHTAPPASWRLGERLACGAGGMVHLKTPHSTLPRPPSDWVSWLSDTEEGVPPQERGCLSAPPVRWCVSRWQIHLDMCDAGEHPLGPKSRATLSREAVWFPPRPMVTEPTVASEKSRQQQAGAPASHLNCSSPGLPADLTLNHCTCGKPLASGSHLQQEWPE